MTYRSNLARVVAAVERGVNNAVSETAATLEAETKKQLDVLIYSTPAAPTYTRTGNLINSVQHRNLAPGKAEVSAQAAYAAYVHEGTRNMSPRPFMANAIKADEPKLAARVKRNIAKELGNG